MTLHLGLILSIASTLPVAFSQTLKAQETATDPYTLNVAVDEVSLTFHAADFHGIPMDDLKLDDLRVLDNGKRQRQIVSFEAHQNLPVHFGVLMDTSQSMLGYLSRNQWIATEYLTKLLHKEADRAFIMRFDSESKVLQDWTGDSDALTATLRDVASDYASRLGGTALFDSIYKTCRDQFGTKDPLAGNFILPFTDGIDNASHARTPATLALKTTSTFARRRTSQSTSSAPSPNQTSPPDRRFSTSWRPRPVARYSSIKFTKASGTTFASSTRISAVNIAWFINLEASNGTARSIALSSTAPLAAESSPPAPATTPCPDIHEVPEEANSRPVLIRIHRWYCSSLTCSIQSTTLPSNRS